MKNAPIGRGTMTGCSGCVPRAARLLMVDLLFVCRSRPLAEAISAPTEDAFRKRSGGDRGPKPDGAASSCRPGSRRAGDERDRICDDPRIPEDSMVSEPARADKIGIRPGSDNLLSVPEGNLAVAMIVENEQMRAAPTAGDHEVRPSDSIARLEALLHGVMRLGRNAEEAGETSRVLLGLGRRGQKNDAPGVDGPAESERARSGTERVADHRFEWAQPAGHGADSLDELGQGRVLPGRIAVSGCIERDDGE